MTILRKWLGEIEQTKGLGLLLLIGGLYAFSIALSNTFVNIYLWKQSENFLDLAIYNLTIVIFHPLTFILAGRWAKIIDRVIVLRIGVIFLTLFYLSVLLVGTHASQFLIVLGALLGIGYGFYWLAFNVLTFEITEPETRDFFNGFLGTLTSAGGMIGPILAGFIISRFASNTGYTIIFALSLVLFAAAVLCSFFLKRRGADGKYCFWDILKERKRNANWRYVTTAHFFQGLREGSFSFVIAVLVFLSTGSELSLGTYGLVHSAVAFIFYLLAAKYIHKKTRKKAILFGALLLYAAIFMIIFELTYTRFLLYGVMIAIAYPIFLVPYTSITYDVIGKGWKAAEMRIEYIVVREMFLNLGRIISVLTFIVSFSFFHEEKSIPIFLLITGIGHIIAFLFIRKIHLPSVC